MWQQILSFFKSQPEGDMAANFYLGESLVGEGNEIAHIDLIIGEKAGHAGAAFCNALANNKDGLHHSAGRGEPEPPLQAGHRAVQQGHDQGRQAGGADVRPRAGGRRPRGRRFGRIAASSRKDKANDWCILVGVFIHWQAEDDKKIFQFNYEATKQSIERALKGQPTIDAVLTGAKTARHPFSGVDNA